MAIPAALVADATCLEPSWLHVRRVRLATGKPTHRFVHFSDVHHKGDVGYLRSVVKRINSLSPDFVCFTGDLVEERRYLSEALEILISIKSPLFGVPGNHDYWSKSPFPAIDQSFRTTGGGWLLDRNHITGNGQINLIGTICSHANQAPLPIDPARKNILLMHYPAWIKNLRDQKFDLILAGHSHGGQVRIPFFGPLIVPYGVDQYDMGLFRTPAGPLYVNAGIGYIYTYDFRFNCRPEITVIEI